MINYNLAINKTQLVETMYTLGIETTCDETGFSIVKDGKIILSNSVSSQIDLHKTFGGVVPELACRRHIELIIPVFKDALKKANLSFEDIDLIAVAKGPGLIGALLIGLNAAKALALALDKPFIGVNHVEAHLYASLMSLDSSISFPCLGVVLSGGHTCIVKIHSLGKYELIGQTVDDAIGEAFDKVAKVMGLPYPGGPVIEKLAKNGNPNKYPFKAGQVKNNPFSFSFSGIKTAVLYAVKGQSAHQNSPILISEEEKKDIAASFQYKAFSDIIKKTLKACDLHHCNTIIFGGGVTNNQTLRKMFNEKDNSKRYLWPKNELTLDNAAMIAGLGYHKFLEKGKGDFWDLEPSTAIPLHQP